MFYVNIVIYYLSVYKNIISVIIKNSVFIEGAHPGYSMVYLLSHIFNQNTFYIFIFKLYFAF